ERRYYISSMAGDDAKQMLAAGRDHWGGENKVHWCLDMSCREDECRIRTGRGAENFARLRRLSINVLKAETTAKVGLASKRMRCGRGEFLSVFRPIRQIKTDKRLEFGSWRFIRHLSGAGSLPAAWASFCVA
ncbi:MAG: ISAs1 family transposase, partial [Phycisphaeraceae bacterium]